MAMNVNPIFTGSGDVSANGTTTMPLHIIIATADYSGISVNHALVFTADATNGGFIQRLRFQAEGTNIATVARIYINNGSTAATATNNWLYGQISLPATTAINTAATIEIDYPMNFAINPGFRIYVGLGTTVASGWMCGAIGGKYTAL